MNPLASFGGGLSASSGSKTGDASSGLDQSWNYNSAFQVGGSGKQSQDAGLTASKDNGLSNTTVLYVAGGIAALAVLGALVVALRK
jgi:hypothetical protein